MVAQLCLGKHPRPVYIAVSHGDRYISIGQAVAEPHEILCPVSVFLRILPDTFSREYRTRGKRRDYSALIAGSSD